MRPPSIAEICTTLVEWLDLADRAYTRLAQQEGSTLVLGRSVQGDLLVMAEWFRQHPDVDAELYAVLDAVSPP